MPPNLRLLASSSWEAQFVRFSDQVDPHKMHQLPLHGGFDTALLTLSVPLRRSVNPEVKLR